MDAEGFIARWAGAAGTERQNSQPFLIDLCDLLGVERPGAPGTGGPGDYAFERPVEHAGRDMRSTHFIDLYRRGAFILESKQSSQRIKDGRDPRQGSLLPAASEPGAAPDTAPGTPAWDRLMRRAFLQAKGYVADLPADHASPPFLILVDVGRVVELYADFTGQGRNYAQFPDRATFQVPLERLRDAGVRERLRRVWTDSASLNPALGAARVTREVAERLAVVAARLEARHEPGAVAGFLMRCLFTMFAEDAGLLPKDGFKDLLADLRDRPGDFVPALEALWASMDRGGYDGALRATLRRFNGGLFADRTALPLDAGGIHELHVAASKNWREVEPAIFGTFLERALNPRERSRLGAHYTPRAYVERLVAATVIDPLREDWEDAQARMAELVDGGDAGGALAVARAFHRALCEVHVLDPACGTGNFLYVALELLKRLEGDVLERIQALVPQREWELPAEMVGPAQFHGIETNPRAAAIAEVVLWVGFLQWQLRTGGLGAIPDPVLRAHGTIERRDAVLAWAAEQPRLDAGGAPVTEWDRRTYRLHPITGEEVPDPDARVPAVTFLNPRRAEWPPADFIVSNPPFIGGRQLRTELGDGYVEALWTARPQIPRGADIVMHWWDEAGRRLSQSGGRLRRFGFITTNSITQVINRQVAERHLRDDKCPVSLAFAVPDHPWVKGEGRAAVRIAMTVMRRGKGGGVLGTVAEERDLDTDAPLIRLDLRVGVITAKLELGADVTAARALLANDSLSFQGCKLVGAGFLVDAAERGAILREQPELAERLPAYFAGSDITTRNQGRFVLDLFGLSLDEAQRKTPQIVSRLMDGVKPLRDQVRRAGHRDRWWIFGEPRPAMRSALAGVPTYLATSEVSRHRMFVRLPWPAVLLDGSAIAIALDGADHLALLSSRVHVTWAMNAGGRMGIGNDPRYQNVLTFDPFPFPALLTDPAPDPHAIALRDRLRDLGERLEALRTDRLAALPRLTLTGLYNRMERRREALAGGAPLTEEEREDHAQAHVPLLADLHDDIDGAALGAWGWDDLAPALVGRPGGTLPSDLKRADQEAAEEELLARLVALNAARRAEEARGRVRWLRPAYQVPRLGARVPGGAEQTALDVGVPAALPDAPPWPDEERAQFGAVRALLDAAPAPLGPDDVARAFKGRLSPKRRARVATVLAVMADLGLARKAEGAALYATRR